MADAATMCIQTYQCAAAEFALACRRAFLVLKVISQEAEGVQVQSQIRE